MAGGWASLGLLPELVEAVEDEFEWMLPTDIQDEAIPLILGGSDVMASAETGSGKTAAFALPILQLCAESKEKQSDSGEDSSKNTDTPDPWWRMSALDRSRAIAIDPNSQGLRIQSRDANTYVGCRANRGIKLGAAVDDMTCSFAVKVLDEGGIVRVGVATADASLQLGTDAEGWGYGSTGPRVHKNDYQDYPSSGKRIAYGKDDVIGCHLTLKKKTDDGGIAATLSYSKNGELIGEAFQLKQGSISTVYPTICMRNAECVLQFDEQQEHLPQGYTPLSKLDAKLTVANPRDSLVTSKNAKGPMAIVIEPTRDLAEQSYRVFDDLCQRIKDVVPVQSALLVGGISPKATTTMLEKNQVDILVGTPPILASYMKKGTIRADRCRFFVLDEADELITNDSIKNIEAIYGRLLPAAQHRSSFDRLQVCFFSATLDSKEVRDLADKICHMPLWIKLRGDKTNVFPDTVHHCAVMISPETLQDGAEMYKTDSVHRKGNLKQAVSLKNLDENETKSEKIKQLKMRAVLQVMEAFQMEQVLVFCRTNLDCDLMEAFLNDQSGGKGIVQKYSCRVLAGMRSMEERQKSLQSFKDGEARILLATDVAARGIDIRELPYVINMTLPDEAATYVHRVGRVGRAERMGLAISLVGTAKERVWFCRKGKKPPVSDTRDFDKGGNCIWYNEPELFAAIEKLFTENSIKPTKLEYPKLDLPPEIKTILETGGYGDYAREEAVDPELQEKLQSLQVRVAEVTAMETTLQTDYWKLRRKGPQKTVAPVAAAS